MSEGRNSLVGVTCGMAAGALWGLVLLAPKLLDDFSPLELTVGRYLLYGLIAAALLAPRWHEVVSRLGRREWQALAWLAFAGNTLCYVLVSSAVQIGGIAMTSLVIGFMPVAVTIIGSRDRDAVPLRRLLPSLMFCAAGALCIGWQALTAPVSSSVASQLAGLLCAVGGLASWTSYAVGNSRWLARLEHVSVHDWNLLTGVVTGAQTLALIPVAVLLNSSHHSVGAWAQFAAVSAGLALLASILGNALWNRMCRLLPLTLVGQMILFETVFALLYGFLWERRMPTQLEAAALIMVVLSVLSCVAAHRKTSQSEPGPDGPCLADAI